MASHRAHTVLGNAGSNPATHHHMVTNRHQILGIEARHTPPVGRENGLQHRSHRSSTEHDPTTIRESEVALSIGFFWSCRLTNNPQCYYRCERGSGQYTMKIRGKEPSRPTISGDTHKENHSVKKLKTIAIAAFMALAMLLPAAAPALAAWPINGDCDYFSQGNYFGSMGVGYNTGNNGTAADIWTDTARFQPCTNPNTEGGGVSQWVALSGGTEEYNIVQIGVIKCNKLSWTQYSDGACSTTSRLNTLNYFYAWGTANCAGFSDHLPRPVYLGTTFQTNYDNFKVEINHTTHVIRMLINGVVKKSMSIGSMCWIDDAYVKSSWATERWDPNDGFGSTEGPTHFDDMQLSVNNGAPSYTSYTASCGSVYLDPEFNCHLFSSDHAGFSTTNQ